MAYVTRITPRNEPKIRVHVPGQPRPIIISAKPDPRERGAVQLRIDAPPEIRIEGHKQALPPPAA